MAYDLEIPAGDILKEGKKAIPGFFDIPYIIYVRPGDPRKRIRINTRYLPRGDSVRLDVHYDRGLCDTLEEYRRLSREAIEEQAYGAWMDGAR